MLGWKTYSFGELQLVHHRLTGTAEGLLRDRIKHGVACYVSGYDPLFLARELRFEADSETLRRRFSRDFLWLS